MDTKDILRIVSAKKILRTSDVAGAFRVSRQYASRQLAELVLEGLLIKIGSTKNASYALPRYAAEHPEIFPLKIARGYLNKDLEEHIVLSEIETAFPTLKGLPENVRSIFVYAFSEMLNNAIEHSESVRIRINIAAEKGSLTFIVDDGGIGVFRNIMHKRRLRSELEAIQDLLKGKMTTTPRAHSGEGIFFTSRVSDVFMLDSFGQRLVINNEIKDIFLQKLDRPKRGTRVTFKIRLGSERHLNNVFKEYTNIGEESDYGFDKTEIKVRLYLIGGVHISRSQARRVLSGLEKFRVVIFDFDRVPMVGQAFADEIFRVFAETHPHIRLEIANANETVKFMTERVEKPREERLFSDGE